VFERLLARRAELTDCYGELHQKLAGIDRALPAMLDALVETPAGWGEEAIGRARQAHKRLVELSQLIATGAAELASLMRERTAISNAEAFDTGSAFHLCDLIDQAGEHLSHYGPFLKGELWALRTRFDGKYWPEPADVVAALAKDAARATVTSHDPVTQAATRSNRASRRDQVRSLMQVIEEQKRYRVAPKHFQLTDRSMASLTNVLFDLAGDQMVSDEDIKNTRHSLTRSN
jgi:hypothetical protein